MLDKIFDAMYKLDRKLFGTMDEPTTLACVLFIGFILGAIAFCTAGLIAGCVS